MADERKVERARASEEAKFEKKEQGAEKVPFSKNLPGSSLAPKRTSQFYKELEETESGLSYQSGSGGMEPTPMHRRRKGEESFKGAPSVMAGQKPRSGNPEGIVPDELD